MFDLKAEAHTVAQSPVVPWQKLSGATVLITGVTGLIGSACARVLLERNRTAATGIRVVGLARDAKRAAHALEGYDAQDGLMIVEGDLLDGAVDGLRPDYLIHSACPTASKFFAEHPVETADAIVLGTRHMLELARTAVVKGFVYVSSMEVYGDGNGEPGLEHLLAEGDVGYVNPTSVRSCYPEGKRMAEQYCAAYASEYGVPASTVRLAQTFGPGIPKNDTRLFAMCARNAMAGKDIVLKTAGTSTRMYLYTADAITAILTVLLKGDPGAVYNAANPSTYSSVRQMAEMVATLFPDKGIRVRCELDPSAPYPPEHHLPLNVAALEALGWQPTVDLPRMYENLVQYLED